MKITRDNYEQYFLDHAEGNLSPELERELADFLNAHPDLEKVLGELDLTPVPVAEIHNDNLKHRLKKKIHPTAHINEANVDEWLIRNIEGLLGDNEEKELNRFISLNPAFSYDMDKYGQTRFSPDLSVAFPGKESLKKKTAVFQLTRLAWLIPAAAAVVLIFIGVRYFRQPVDRIETPSQIAETPSQITETPSQITETPSQIDETPSQPLPLPRADVFRMTPASSSTIVLAAAKVVKSDVSLVLYEIEPIQIPEIKEKPLIAKVFANMMNQAKEGLRNQAKLDKLDRTDFTLWSLAKAGVNGYNTIADRELELYVQRDAEGNVTSYALIEHDRLVLEKSLDKN
jgi:hypothetical protein